MASFASSATTDDARKHAWTNFQLALFTSIERFYQQAYFEIGHKIKQNIKHSLIYHNLSEEVLTISENERRGRC